MDDEVRQEVSRMDAEAIARGLSKGDKIRIRACTNSEATLVKFSAQALFRLVQIGVADPIDRDARGNLRRVVLNPSGISVRAILLREQGDTATP